MPSYGSLHSPSLRKMDQSRMGYGGRRGIKLGNIIGDPFALATISIALVCGIILRFLSVSSFIFVPLTEFAARVDNIVHFQHHWSDRGPRHRNQREDRIVPSVCMVVHRLHAFHDRWRVRRSCCRRHPNLPCCPCRLPRMRSRPHNVLGQ